MTFFRSKSDPGKRSTAHNGYLVGQMLIAMPGMSDPRFQESVIFLCRHDAAGAVGLLVNKPVSSMTFEDLLRQLSIQTAGRSRVAKPVQFGGPVETARGFVLHSPDYRAADNSTWVAGGLHVTMTVDVLRAIAEGGGPRQAMVALGYAGWSAGHLERELQEHCWLYCAPDDFLLFSNDFGAKWAHAMRMLGFTNLGNLSQQGGSA